MSSGPNNPERPRYTGEEQHLSLREHISRWGFQEELWRHVVGELEKEVPDLFLRMTSTQQTILSNSRKFHEEAGDDEANVEIMRKDLEEQQEVLNQLKIEAKRVLERANISLFDTYLAELAKSIYFGGYLRYSREK